MRYSALCVSKAVHNINEPVHRKNHTFQTGWLLSEITEPPGTPGPDHPG